MQHSHAVVDGYHAFFSISKVKRVMCCDGIAHCSLFVLTDSFR